MPRQSGRKRGCIWRKQIVASLYVGEIGPVARAASGALREGLLTEFEVSFRPVRYRVLWAANHHSLGVSGVYSLTNRLLKSNGRSGLGSLMR